MNISFERHVGVKSVEFGAILDFWIRGVQLVYSSKKDVTTGGNWMKNARGLAILFLTTEREFKIISKS